MAKKIIKIELSLQQSQIVIFALNYLNVNFDGAKDDAEDHKDDPESMLDSEEVFSKECTQSGLIDLIRLFESGIDKG